VLGAMLSSLTDSGASASEASEVPFSMNMVVTLVVEDVEDTGVKGKAAIFTGEDIGLVACPGLLEIGGIFLDEAGYDSK
jgi:hypothetical protein